MSTQPQSISGAEYVAGSWIAMTTLGFWMLVDAGSHRDLWAACWKAVRESADVADVLAVVARAGVASTPDFALVRCDGRETRVVVRGRPNVELRYGADATTHVRAASDGDWTDRLFAGMPLAVRLANVSEPGYTPDGAAMPLECGVAQASTVGLALDSFARPVPPVVESAELRPLAEFVAEQPSAHGAGADGAAGADFNLDGFLLQQSTADAGLLSAATAAHGTVPPRTGRLPLDDTSWLGDQATHTATTHAAPTHTATTHATTHAAPTHAAIPDAVVAPDPAPPLPPPPVPEVAAPTATGLPFDAEATTFRPGRAPVQIGGAGQPVVLAVVCPSGHANPPRTPECRVCRLPIAAEQQPRALARPPLGRLRLSTGEVHVLDRGFLLGRSPVPRAAATGPEPNVLRLMSRDGDVSRTHAEIRLEGWQVIVADLGSMNGTYVSGPGLPPRVLSGSDEQVIEPGTVVTLAHDVWIAYEVAE